MFRMFRRSYGVINSQNDIWRAIAIMRDPANLRPLNNGPVSIISGNKGIITVVRQDNKEATEVTSAMDVAVVMHQVTTTTHQKKRFFNTVRKQLPDLIKNAIEFVGVMKTLLPADRDNLFNDMKHQLSDFVKSTDDFTRINGVLTNDRDREIFSNAVPETFREPQVTESAVPKFIRR